MDGHARIAWHVKLFAVVQHFEQFVVGEFPSKLAIIDKFLGKAGPITLFDNTSSFGGADGIETARVLAECRRSSLTAPLLRIFIDE